LKINKKHTRKPHFDTGLW